MDIKQKKQGICLPDKHDTSSEIALLRSYFKTLFDSSIDAIAVIDQNRKPIMVNNIFCEMLGYSPEDLLKISVEDISFTGYDYQSAEDTYEKFRENGKDNYVVNKKYRKRNGKIIDVRVKVARIDNTDMMLAFVEDISDRVNAEKKIGNYKRFFEISSDIMVIAEGDYFIEVNSQLSNVLGYSEHELTSKPYLAFVHPDDVELTKREAEKVTQNNPSSEFTNRYITKEGEVKYLLWSCSVEFSLGLAFATAKDITDITKTKNSIELGKEKLYRIINSVPDPIYILSKDYRITDVNNAATQVLGYSKKELLSKSLNDVDVNSAGTISRIKSKSDIKESLTFETLHQTKNGDKIPVEINGQIIGLNYDTWIIGISRDISKRNKLVDQIRESEKRYRRIFSSISEGYILYDQTGLIFNINPSAERILGINHEDIKLESKNIKDYYVDENYLKYELVTLKKNNKLLNQTVEVENEEGEILLLKFQKNLIKHSDDSFLIEATFEEVTHDHYFNSLIKATNLLYKKLEEKSYEELIRYGLDTCESLLKSRIAFFHFLNEDQNPIKFATSGSLKEKIYGMHESLTQDPISGAGNWADCVKLKSPVVHNDYSKTNNNKNLHKDHFYLKREMEVPIIEEGKVVAVIGVGNKHTPYSKADVAQLQAFSSNLWTVLRWKKDMMELNKANFFLQEAQTVGRIGSWIMNLKDNENWWSDTMKEIHGLKPTDETPWIELYDRINHEDRNGILAAFENAKKTGKYDYTYGIRRYDNNEKIILHAKSKLIFDSNNEPLMHIGIAQDISNQFYHDEKVSQLTNNLEINNRRLEYALESINAITIELDVKSYKLYFTNSQYRDFFDINHPLKNLDQLNDIIRTKHLVSWKNKIGELISGESGLGFMMDLKTYTQTEEWKWKQFKTEIIEWENGTPKTIFMVVRDINKQKELDKVEVYAQEEERLRVSRDIHDSIGQMLVGTRLMLNQTLNKSSTLEKMNRLNCSIDEMLKEMIDESRMIINNLGVALSKNETLRSTFEELINKMYRVYKGSVEFNWEGEENMKDMKFATNVFRVFQEALSNTIKYSNAELVKVNIKNKGSFEMQVIDYGDGFNASKDIEGFGIKNMLDRANQIGAQLNIESEIGKGTKVKLTLGD